MGTVMDEVDHRVLRYGNDVHKLVIMLAHACDNSPVQGNMKLQKLVFMLSSIDDNEMGFRPDTDGPRSDIVEMEVRHLCDRGILSIENNKIQLTDAGRSVAKHIAEEDLDTFETIARYKEMFNDLDTDEILMYVCRSYPSMVPRSLVDRLEPDIEKHVLSMLRKEKISGSKAAELLDEGMEYVIDVAYKNGIYIMGY